MSTMVPAYGGAVMVSSSVHRRSAVSTAMAAQRVCTPAPASHDGWRAIAQYCIAQSWAVL